MAAVKQLSVGNQSIESKNPVDLYRSLSKNQVMERKRHATASMDMRTIAKFLCQMKVTKPEVLRATPEYRALQGCGRALRGNPDPMRLFALSQEVDVIDEFWSHSWHGESWKKILLLLVLKNGKAAMAVGTLGASLAMFLFMAGILPGKYNAGRDYDALNSCWCVWTGILLSSVTLAFWKTRKMVFLDRVCVNQVDEDEKCEAILSIGALLKSSQAMLVLWDTTYVERLWCVFELAAYIKSHGDGENRQPTIRPTLLGPCTCSVAVSTAVFMLVALMAPFDDPLLGVRVGFFAAAALFRGFYRAIETTKEQMRNFSVQGAKCACCDLGHTGEGALMLCDRRIVLSSCIDQWYGSIDVFEESVQSVVREELARQLGQDAFPYLWFVTASVPVVWGMMDIVAIRVLAGAREAAIHYAIVGLVWWLCVFPSLFAAWSKLAFLLRHRGRRGYDILMNFLCCLAWPPLLALVYAFQYACTRLLDDEVYAALVFATTWTVVVLVTRSPCLRGRARKPPTAPNESALPDEPAPEPAPEPNIDEKDEQEGPWRGTGGHQVYVHVSV
eukprot:CAMPEP_0181399144 /NCGR_PEP_ID=MMETSP1110-20121109/1429_1 /TAXON_ID=174948 /ORGANISM="Symbiodinium sp., Strain CCMP421" /LENGTH=557 /DNA_ID=CAMNT_0023521165 /DNA_START=105 /DNA_END=1779 /DNA_ORIENTATION=-